jgi:Na+-driven multidrug efflux pump
VVLVPTLISIACILVVQVGVAWGLNARLGLEGIWIAFPVAYLAMLALQTAYFRGVWRHRKIRRLI